ncbi:hypothetical protein IEU95_03270 [Hoyosella rhizosphaerae]|uniref:Glucosylceramidase n=1 Tax=Hoyosella rhizosphaerae TaxID=1755582 RepID=A0A916UE13_9ACTN|nr:glycoside hydrolase family 30 beta sandwich domain-containing protein [Hoyosella rhizosphaerae]MBN4925835.1 hypothetical protein [Hoyosella rhizosphaerae]GGC67566.1 glucosylceramidase [Hoyosella rhizosphaerae]
MLVRSAIRAGVVVALSLTTVAALTVSGQSAPVRAQGAEAQVWLTTGDRSVTLQQVASVPLTSRKASGPNVITVNPTSRHQVITGFGASITGASAFNIASLSAEARAELMSELFNPNTGIGLNYLRQPMGASDFNAPGDLYTYQDELDPDADDHGFSVDIDEQLGILPLIREALSENPGLRVMGTPWSAPAWMKSSGDLRGGALNPESMSEYAQYFVRFVEQYRERGVAVQMVTPGNEPLFANPKYPSMQMGTEQQAEFVRELDSAFSDANLDTEILVFDHNWSDAWYAADVLNKTADVERVVGAAFHCYHGDPSAQTQVIAAGKRVMVTECTGVRSSDTFLHTLLWQFQNLIVESSRNGSEGTTLWNLALDAEGGPHQGYCDDRCRGVVEVADGTYSLNAEYYVLGHASKFVKPGAVRLGSNSGTGSNSLRNVAFENPDGSRVVLLMNPSGRSQRYSVTDGAVTMQADIEGNSVATIVW